MDERTYRTLAGGEAPDEQLAGAAAPSEVPARRSQAWGKKKREVQPAERRRSVIWRPARPVVCEEFPSHSWAGPKQRAAGLLLKYLTNRIDEYIESIYTIKSILYYKN